MSCLGGRYMSCLGGRYFRGRHAAFPGCFPMSDQIKVFLNVKDSGHRIEPELEQKELAAIGYVTAQWAFWSTRFLQARATLLAKIMFR